MNELGWNIPSYFPDLSSLSKHPGPTRNMLTAKAVTGRILPANSKPNVFLIQLAPNLTWAWPCLALWSFLDSIKNALLLHCSMWRYGCFSKKWDSPSIVMQLERQKGSNMNHIHPTDIITRLYTTIYHIHLVYIILYTSYYYTSINRYNYTLYLFFSSPCPLLKRDVVWLVRTVGPGPRSSLG